MSDAPEKAKEIWAVVGYIGPQDMRGEWATDPAKIMGGVTSYTRTDLYTAALARAETAEAERDAQQSAKDSAYLERNKLVALLAAIFPAGLKRTDIEGWSPDWHGCVYIDFPWGQASWHYHDSQAHLFAHLPPYPKDWDGHTTETKYAAITDASVRHPLSAIDGYLAAERDAALARMTDLEAAARHNSDWARQAIADKEAVEKERDAANARALRYKRERDGQARKISDAQGLYTASEEAEARIANQRAEINRLQAEVARLTEWDAANRIEALVEEVDALRAALGSVCDSAARLGASAMSTDAMMERFSAVENLNAMAAAVRSARDLLEKGTPNAD